MKGLRIVLAAAGMMLAAGTVWAQAVEQPAVMTFEFQRPQVTPAEWRLTLNANGDGVYEEMASGDAAGVKQAVHVGSATLKRLMSGVEPVRSGKCETKLKNVADMGRKTITYQTVSGGAVARCTYNMPESERLQDATTAALAVQQTLLEGQRLAFKHRFDRLGLDAEMDALVGLVKDGRGAELRNIGQVLESIAADDQVMKRVRTKAEELLKLAQVEG